MEQPMRDHLFVSYATEDRELAKWLTMKLVSRGYAVWCDQFKLLGGESYPRDIDHAMKECTFRVLALLSKASMGKANPRKERTLALNIARERKCDFLIPINVDGLLPTELDWMLSDLTFVPFHHGWKTGFEQLLEKLTSIQAPKVIADGKRVVTDATSSTNVITNQRETLLSNWLLPTRIPKTIHAHTLSERPRSSEWVENSLLRSSYRIDPTTFLSFEPHFNFQRVASRPVGSWSREISENILGVQTSNVVSSLIRRNLTADLLQKGLVTFDRDRSFFFPRNLLAQDKLTYKGIDGRSSWLKVIGFRTFSRGPNMREMCTCHLAVKLRIRQDLFAPYVIEIRNTLQILSSTGQSLSVRASHSRRRKITKDWHNDKWRNRYLATLEFVCGGTNSWKVNGSGEAAIEISGTPVMATSEHGVNDELLAKGSEEVDETEQEIVIAEDEDDIDERDGN